MIPPKRIGTGDRALNTRNIPDCYPIRHIADFTQTLRCKKIFSKIDLVLAFNQIPIAEEDNAITTPFSLLESLFMIFRLHNAAPGRRGYPGTQFLASIYGSYLVSSIDKDEHLKHLHILFQRLFLAFLKYSFLAIWSTLTMFAHHPRR